MSGWHDVPLSRQGALEAYRLAQTLRGERIDALYSSTSRRAVQTAAPLARALGMHPHLEPDLREISCGTLEGETLADVRRRFPTLWQRNMRQRDEDFCWPGGESYRAFRERVLACMRTIAAQHAGQHVAVVTHAGVISQVLGALHGASPANWEAWRPANASITVVHWRQDRAALLRFDWRPSAAPDVIGAT
jgi:broad specificity phosphatase PhoE